MSEMRLPEIAPPPLPPAQSAGQAPKAGSLALGVALAWAINVIGGIIFALIGSWFLARPGSRLWPIVGFGSIPLLASIGLAVWMIMKGPRRTGFGILIGIGSIWAVQLLLLAACFGLIFAVSGH